MKVNRQNERRTQQINLGKTCGSALSYFDRMMLNQAKQNEQILSKNERNFGSNILNKNPFFGQKHEGKIAREEEKRKPEFRRTISVPNVAGGVLADLENRGRRNKVNKLKENVINMSSIPEDDSENVLEPSNSRKMPHRLQQDQEETNTSVPSSYKISQIFPRNQRNRSKNKSNFASKISRNLNFSKESLATEAETKTTENCVESKKAFGGIYESFEGEINAKSWRRSENCWMMDVKNGREGDVGGLKSSLASKLSSNLLNNTKNKSSLSPTEKLKYFNLKPKDIVVPQAEKDKVNDPNYCLEYLNENLREQKILERTTSPNYAKLTMGELADFDHFRRKCLYRMIKQQIKFNLLDETYYLSMNILDRFKISNKENQIDDCLLSASIIFTASKYEEIYPPYITDYYPNKSKMVSTENVVLPTVEYNLCIASPVWFLNRFHSISGQKKIVLELAKLMLDIGCLKFKFVKIRNSLKACICLYYAIKTYNEHISKSGDIFNENFVLLRPINKRKFIRNNDDEINTDLNIWSNDLKLFTGYNEKDLTKGLSILSEIINDNISKYNNFTNIFMKKNKQNPSNIDYFNEPAINGILLLKYAFVNRFNVSSILFPLIKEEKMLK